MAQGQEQQAVVLQEQKIAPTCKALSVFGEVTEEISTLVQELVDNTISLKEC